MTGRILGWGVVIFIACAIAVDLGMVWDEGETPRWFWLLLASTMAAAACYAIVQRQLIKYVLARSVEAVFTLLAVATITFLLMRFMPGGPFDEERALSPEIRANFEAKYGLNQPLLVQYGRYLRAAAHGDLGPSYKYEGRGVSEIIVQTLPPSFQLGLYALLLSFMVGVPLGIFAAAKRGTGWDTAAMVVAIAGVALPSFMIGPMLVQVFSFGVPISVLHGFLPPALWEGPAYYILPVVTLGLRPAAIVARMVRASMLESIDSDFVRTARAKGASEAIVLIKHALKNSLIPTLSVAGPLAAGVLSGSFVIELVFAIPGIGKHLVQSVSNRDYPLILGVTLVYAGLLVAANLIVDVLYTVVDPRIELA